MNGLDLVYFAAATLTAPVWMRKKRAGWRQRLGHAEPIPGGDRPRVLLHAVSVGEVNALRPLVPLLLGRAEVIVSTTTDTGLARAQTLFSESCTVVRYPLDFSNSVGRFLDATRPDVVGLVELELWPNFLRACQRRTIPVGVINGRLSARSFRGYKRFRRFVGPMFRALVFAGVQDAQYYQRFVAMGVDADRCTITGSMKWDTVDVSRATGGATDAARAIGRALGIDPDRPLIVAGSTGPGEEALLHEACPVGVQLVCAPRKPERFDEAAAAMPGCARRSQQHIRGEDAPDRSVDRFLLDTIGELGLLYQLADVVVIGRSFFDLYGSDPIEAAALGKPVVIGTATSDFDAIVRALSDHAGIVVTDRFRLGDTLSRLMGDSVRRDSLGARARACVGEQQGAAQRHAELLLSSLSC